MSEFPTGENPEFTSQAEVAYLADRANIDPRLLEGAKFEKLHGEALTIDTREMQNIDGEGVVAIIGVGVSALKLYKQGNGAEAMMFLAPGSHSEEAVDGRQQVIDAVFIDPGSSRTFGRSAPYKTRLGLRNDASVSGSHFTIERSQEGQLRIEDSSTNGLSLITKEAPRQKLGRLVDIPLQKQFGKIILPGNIEPPKS